MPTMPKYNLYDEHDGTMGRKRTATSAAVKLGNKKGCLILPGIPLGKWENK